MGNVVITGATKGIGLGYARAFLTRGHGVCITGRNATAVAKVVETLAKEAPAGVRVIGVPCDVSVIAQVQAVWDRAARELGRIDIWVNNAGFARTGVGFLAHTPGELRAMVDSNVIGTINATQVAVRGMQGQGGGHIFNTLGGGSDGRVYPGMIGYSTTKRAVRYFTECLAKELGVGPVRVGTISPGVNITDGMLREMAALPPERRRQAIWAINVVGDHVETTTPWLVDRMLAAAAAGRQGARIAWMSGAKIMGRFLLAPFRKRDLLSRYGVTAA
jgi:NAD(P)-dependent dehydrogenase (short-subunit alcohol dehydrogenase family)